MAHLNAAFYCFTPLREPAVLKREWEPRLASSGLKGTIILAPEGLNGFLAGPAEAVRSALSDLRTLPGLGGLRAKESVSSRVPFGRLRIKLKKEIVTFRERGPWPAAPRIAPAELARWLEEKRDVVLLDTRNAYESRLGTFEGAHCPEIAHFVDFAAKARQFPPEWKKKPVVTFCTGGIRCEKAAPYLASLGYGQVYQLEDGILGYFEKVGGRNWRGECFVFDERVALGPDLEPTGARLCDSCQGPVPAAEAACIHCGWKA